MALQRRHMDRNNQRDPTLMNLDSKGLIVPENGNGGDCFQREGFFFENQCLGPIVPVPGIAPYSTALNTLNTSQGFVRYWQAPYNDPSDTSRDQMVSNIRACGYFNYTQYLRAILKGVLKNYSRFPNGDIAFVNDYGRFIRAFKLWWLWPLLLVCDIPLIVNAALICFWVARAPSQWQIWLASKASWLYWLTNQYPPNAEGVPQSPYGASNSSNDINFIGDLAQAQKVYATPVSWLARKLYKIFRPCGIQFALDSYFTPGNNPDFATIWAPIVEKF